MFKKTLLALAMFAVVLCGGMTLTAGPCQDACLATYTYEYNSCYDYPATSWLRKACFIAATNRYNNCLAQCP